MSRAFIVLPAARLDIIAAHAWYEAASPGLGAAFRSELDRQVREAPRRFPVVIADVRRAALRRFPYGLFFRERGDAIYLLACFHGSRDPQVWRRRV